MTRLLLVVSILLASVSVSSGQGNDALYSQWNAADAVIGAQSDAPAPQPKIGSFQISRPTSELFIGGLTKQWRDTVAAAASWQQVEQYTTSRLRSEFILDDTSETDFSDWLSGIGRDAQWQLARGSADYFASYLTAAAQDSAGGLSFVRNVEWDYQTALGERRWSTGLSALGALRESQDDAVVWQMRAFAAEESGKGANVGLIYRTVTGADDSGLFGVNTFIDYESLSDESEDFWRWSVGAEYRSEIVNVYLNRYLAITDGKLQPDGAYLYTQDGMDAELDLNLPGMKMGDVSGGLTYYRWEGEYGDKDDTGMRYHLQFSPGNISDSRLRLRLELDSPDDGSTDWGGSISYRYLFGAPPPSGGGARAGSFDPRAHFFDAVRREYSQRIRRSGDGAGHALNYGWVAGTVYLDTSRDGSDVRLTVASAAANQRFPFPHVATVTAGVNSTLDVWYGSNLTVRVQEESEVIFQAGEKEINISVVDGLITLWQDGNGGATKVDTITAGGATVVLLGTALEIGVDDDGNVTIALAEGAIDITAPDSPASPDVDVAVGKVTLGITPGSEVVVDSLAEEQVTVNATLAPAVVVEKGTVTVMAPTPPPTPAANEPAPVSVLLLDENGAVQLPGDTTVDCDNPIGGGTVIVDCGTKATVAGADGNNLGAERADAALGIPGSLMLYGRIGATINITISTEGAENPYKYHFQLTPAAGALRLTSPADGTAVLSLAATQAGEDRYQLVASAVDAGFFSPYLQLTITIKTRVVDELTFTDIPPTIYYRSQLDENIALLTVDAIGVLGSVTYAAANGLPGFYKLDNLPGSAAVLSLIRANPNANTIPREIRATDNYDSNGASASDSVTLTVALGSVDPGAVTASLTFPNSAGRTADGVYVYFRSDATGSFITLFDPATDLVAVGNTPVVVNGETIALSGLRAGSAYSSSFPADDDYNRNGRARAHINYPQTYTFEFQISDDHSRSADYHTTITALVTDPLALTETGATVTARGGVATVLATVAIAENSSSGEYTLGFTQNPNNWFSIDGSSGVISFDGAPLDSNAVVTVIAAVTDTTFNTSVAYNLVVNLHTALRNETGAAQEVHQDYSSRFYTLKPSSGEPPYTYTLQNHTADFSINADGELARITAGGGSPQLSAGDSVNLTIAVRDSGQPAATRNYVLPVALVDYAFGFVDPAPIFLTIASDFTGALATAAMDGTVPPGSTLDAEILFGNSGLEFNLSLAVSSSGRRVLSVKEAIGRNLSGNAGRIYLRASPEPAQPARLFADGAIHSTLTLYLTVRDRVQVSAPSLVNAATGSTVADLFSVRTTGGSGNLSFALSGGGGNFEINPTSGAVALKTAINTPGRRVLIITVTDNVLGDVKTATVTVDVSGKLAFRHVPAAPLVYRTELDGAPIRVNNVLTLDGNPALVTIETTSQPGAVTYSASVVGGAALPSQYNLAVEGDRAVLSLTAAVAQPRSDTIVIAATGTIPGGAEESIATTITLYAAHPGAVTISYPTPKDSVGRRAADGYYVYFPIRYEHVYSFELFNLTHLQAGNAPVVVGGMTVTLSGLSSYRPWNSYSVYQRSWPAISPLLPILHYIGPWYDTKLRVELLTVGTRGTTPPPPLGEFRYLYGISDKHNGNGRKGYQLRLDGIVTNPLSAETVTVTVQSGQASALAFAPREFNGSGEYTYAITDNPNNWFSVSADGTAVEFGGAASGSSNAEEVTVKVEVTDSAVTVGTRGRSAEFTVIVTVNP